MLNSQIKPLLLWKHTTFNAQTSNIHYFVDTWPESYSSIYSFLAFIFSSSFNQKFPEYPATQFGRHGQPTAISEYYQSECLGKIFGYLNFQNLFNMNANMTNIPFVSLDLIFIRIFTPIQMQGNHRHRRIEIMSSVIDCTHPIQMLKQMADPAMPICVRTQQKVLQCRSIGIDIHRYAEHFTWPLQTAMEQECFGGFGELWFEEAATIIRWMVSEYMPFQSQWRANELWIHQRQLKWYSVQWCC